MDLSVHSSSLLNNNNNDNASFQHVPVLPSLSHAFSVGDLSNFCNVNIVAREREKQRQCTCWLSRFVEECVLLPQSTQAAASLILGFLRKAARVSDICTEIPHVLC